MNDDQRQRCDRCGVVMTQLVQLFGGRVWEQPWCVRSGARVSEIDSDICDACGEDVIAACDEYYRTRRKLISQGRWSDE